MKTELDPVKALRDFASRAHSHFGKVIEREQEDEAFASGEQYGKEDRRARGKKRNEMVFNFTHTLCNLTENAFRLNPFGSVVSANVQEKQQKAQLYQAVIRGIERKSRALSAYTNAVGRQVRGGRGWFAITTDYIGSSFDQDIKVEQILRADSVIDDPFSTEIDGTDATERAIVDYMSESAAKEKYGEGVVGDKEDSPLWETAWNPPEGSVCCVTYYRLESEGKMRILGTDGKEYEEDDMPKEVAIKRKRMEYKKEVKVYKIVGQKVVADTEMYCDMIPVFPIKGERITKDKQIQYVGYPYFCKDTQRLVNYFGSSTGERVARAPKANYMASMSAIAPYLDIWKDADKDLVNTLPWEPFDEKNNPNPPPQKLDNRVMVDDLIGAQAAFMANLSSVVGMSPEGGGAMSRVQETAEAVLTRSRAAEEANYQFLDNASKSISAAARCMFQLIPSVYDTPRLLPLVMEDGTTQMAMVDMSEPVNMDEFAIDVDSGPMLASAKKENVKSLIALGTMLGPESALVLAPEIVRNTDFEASRTMADKLEKLANMKLGLGDGQQDPEAVAALQKAEMVVQAKDQQLQQANLYIQQLQAELAQNNVNAQATITKAQIDRTKAIEVELIKQGGEDRRTAAQIAADAESDLVKAQTELAKAETSADQQYSQIAVPVRPDYNSVGGMTQSVIAQ